MNDILHGHMQEINLKKYYYQQGVITNIKEIYDEIFRVIACRKEISDEALNARVFINGGTRDDFGFLLSNKPPLKEENLEEWLKRITMQDSFCAVLNGINGWSDYISTFVNNSFNIPWVEKFGIPSKGVDVYCFMGKYSITPFGIHLDKEHTFLYHLGPGNKKAWVWDPKKVDIKPLIKSDSFNLDETLQYANCIILKPGDALFIPQNWYHVLENPTFSLTLGVAPYEMKKSELVTSVINNFITEGDQEDDYYTFNSQDKECCLSTAGILPSSLKEKSIQQVLSEGITDIRSNLQSNFYFKYPSPYRSVKKKAYKYFGDLVIGRNDGEMLRLHCRGKTILVKSHFAKHIVELKSIMESANFEYTHNEEGKKNSYTFLIKQMIHLGVLV
ncbi:hypothetical protein H2241_21520 [Pantoea ananatis]|uniref:JmjC domain-containing protein n=1 Tax=Pantoea ananas TaxID=553 RepID=UPI00158BCDBA|nr:cupin domain-containing protein [Pantoea ananatis]MBA4823518.1 hypothetical protein [Pantoea ananatis]QKV85883.1 hypothetical protein FOB88_01380 [Pantoea ananatis]